MPATSADVIDSICTGILEDMKQSDVNVGRYTRPSRLTKTRPHSSTSHLADNVDIVRHETRQANDSMEQEHQGDDTPVTDSIRNSHHNVQQTAFDTTRTHNISLPSSSHPSLNSQLCPLCDSKPSHALDNCPLTKNGADALASIIIRLELEHKSKTLISDLKDIWTRLTNEGNSYPMVHNLKITTNTRVCKHSQSKSTQQRFWNQYQRLCRRIIDE